VFRATLRSVTSQCIVVLFGTSLSGYTLLNVSRTAANDFDAKQCSRMNTRSTLEYTMFAPAQLLRNLREQRLSHKGEGGGGWEILLHGGGPASDFIFAP
jgi:hypothetical protein